jgi:predicted GIY-YIG superfamily endonuclease
MTDDGKPADDPGTVYLLHLDPPLKHARHYTGWTSDLDQRLEAHRAGRGARLLEVVKEAGGTFRLARTWAGTRNLERAIKDRKEAPKLCPECSPQPRPLARGRSAGASPQREAAPVTEPAAVPEAETVGDHLRRLRPRPVAPEAYAELMPLTDRLISGWRAELDSAVRRPEPEAEPELEPLPAASRTPVPNPKEQPMGIFSSGQQAAPDPAPPGGWFYDKPLPYTLTPAAEAALDDAAAEADL